MSKNDLTRVYADALRDVSNIVNGFAYVQNPQTQFGQRRVPDDATVKASLTVADKKTSHTVEFPSGYTLTRGPRGDTIKHDKTMARIYLQALADLRVGNGSMQAYRDELAMIATWSAYKVATGRQASKEGAMMSQIIARIAEAGITVDKITVGDDATESGGLQSKVETLLGWLDLNVKSGYMPEVRRSGKAQESSFTL